MDREGTNAAAVFPIRRSSKDGLWIPTPRRQNPMVRSPRTIAAVTAMLIVTATLIVTAVAIPSAQVAGAAGASVRSVIVSLADANCKVVEKPTPGDDGQDWAVLRCGKPAAGWQTYVDYDNSRESLTVANAAGTRTALDLWSFNRGFSSVGPAVDYRVRSGVAIGLVVRHRHQVNPDTGANASTLMVAKLGNKPCVVASVAPGRTQSSKARSLADRADRLPCLAAPS